MPANSNFQQAIREAQSSALIGPNVVNKALPYVGGGMALTGLGVLGGLSLQATNNPLFGPLFIVAFIAEIVLFFMASSAANNANNSKALPLLTGFSLLTGFTLSGIVGLAIQVAGMGAIGTAVFATGITFVIASSVGRKMSDNVGQALQGAVGLGLLGLIIAMVFQFVGGLFALLAALLAMKNKTISAINAAINRGPNKGLLVARKESPPKTPNPVNAIPPPT